MRAQPKTRKGSHKVANVRRSEHRRNRYRTHLRERARHGDAKAARMLDHGRTKAGRHQGRPIG